jgi:hypothetical protein
LKERDRDKTPWSLRISPLFEAAFLKHGGSSPSHSDLLDYVEDMLLADPRSVGAFVQKSHIGEVWVFETPPVQRLPKVRILYEIDDHRGVVVLWNYAPSH